MRNAIILALLSATTVMVGCTKDPSSASTPPPPATNAVAVSDGTNTWFLGATTINGTNVSGTNVTIRVTTREPSK